MRFHRLPLVLLVSVAMVATACGGGGDDSSGTGSGGDEPSAPAGDLETGDLTIAITGIRESFDPITSGAAIKPYISPLFDPLVGLDPDGQANTTTGLATDWSYNDDDTSLTVTIRDDATFHDGEPVTADDVQFSIERSISEDSVTSWAATIRNELASVTAVDPTTIRFDFNLPRPQFHLRLTRLDGQEAYIVSQAFVEGGGNFVTEPIGSGPYRFESAEPGNTSITLVANEDYWRGSPRFDRLILMNVNDASTRLNMLKTGEADFIDIPRDLVADAESSDLVTIASPVASHVELWLLNQWDGIFADATVREAMNLAIDRPTIIDTIFDGKAESANFFPDWPTSIGYSGPGEIPYDPDEARSLIEEAGAEGTTVTLFSYSLPGLSEGPQLMEAVAGYWGEIGLDPEIVQTEYTTVRAQMVEADPALVNSVAWIRDANLRYPDPTMRVLMHSTGALTIHHDPQIDEYVEALEAAPTDDEYTAELESAQAYIAENHLRTPVAEVQQLWAGNPDKVPADLDLGQATSDMDISQLLFLE
jgi:peptide/nickel transport system substrate-binding protein